MEWGRSGDWIILQDPNHENDCLAQVSLSDGSLFRIGFREKGKKGYLATFNPAWREFKIAHEYPVTYILDGDMYEGKAWGIEEGGVRGAEVRFDEVAFLIDLAKRYTLTINSKGMEVVEIDLKGSDAALKEVLVCQAAKD
jgi:hypothetical protein